jgi:hypothetical protein
MARYCTATAATLLEVLAGLTAGVFFATLLGYLLASPACWRTFSSPICCQPGSADRRDRSAAGDLVRPGIFSKVLICSLIVFFPGLAIR